MARGQKQQEAPVEEVEQDVSAYIGVDPVYMNYSDDRSKPFKAEPEDDGEGNDNTHIVEAEETAYAHQAATREQSGQDPETGEAIAVDPDEDYKNRRGAYTHEAQWSPNQATSNNTGVSVAEMSHPTEDTGSTGTVNSDGTTGDKTNTSDTGSGDTGGGDKPSSPTPPAPPAK